MSLFRRHSRKAPIIICVICSAVVAGQYFVEHKIDEIRVPRLEFLLSPLRSFKPLQSGEFYTEDAITRYLGKKANTSPELVYLAIDHQSIELDQFSPAEISASPALTLMKKGWPWSRKVYPLIYERLFNAGAKVVALDLMFPTEREGDEEFRSALDKYHARVVVGSNFVDSNVEGNILKGIQTPTEDLIPLTSPVDDRVGFVNYWPDSDGVIRSANYHVTASEVFHDPPEPDEEVFNSFAVVVLKKSGHAASVPATSAPRRIRFAGKPRTFTAHSVSDIFFEYNWKNRYGNGEYFRDKIVVIGPDGDFLKDIVRTPFDVMPGPELHLNAINAALAGDFLRETAPAVNYLLIVILGLIAWLLSIQFSKPLLRFVLIVVTGALWLFVAQMLYNHASLVVLTFVPIVALGSSGVCCLSWDFFVEQRDKARLRGKFERYVSKQVVKEIVDNPESYFNTQGGMHKPVAIFFSDLRGFTSMTEQAENPRVLVAQLNEYFDVMVAPILDNNGCLDKLIGDAIMAVWGNIQSRGPARDVLDAVTSALRMRELLPALNQRWATEGKLPYAMGMGINYGEVIVGDLGSQQQKNFTVIGDPVNLASRIEGTTKEYGVDLLVGEDAAKLVKDDFLMQTAGLTQVKGRKKPVELFYIIGERPANVEPRQEEYLRVYGEGMALYLKGDFAAAGEKFKRSLELHPPDTLAKVYIDRCEILAREPVPEGWNGVFVMKGK